MEVICKFQKVRFGEREAQILIALTLLAKAGAKEMRLTISYRLRRGKPKPSTAAGQAGLHKQILPARQAHITAQLKSISGCLYAKACLEDFQRWGGQVVGIGRVLHGIPLGYYTTLALGQVHSMASRSTCREMILL